MDLDAYIGAHREEWHRLGTLVRRGRRLSGRETDELVELYQRVAAHLSAIRSAAPDPALVGTLSSLVARARSTVTGAHTPAWRQLGWFATVSFPAAVYRARWWWLGTVIGSLAVMTGVGVWVGRSPAVLAKLADPDTVHRYVSHEFVAYYSNFFAGSFAANVWTNNVMVAAIGLTCGIAFGVPTLYLLWQNAASGGVAAGVMFGSHHGGTFLVYTLPHGLLELTAVFLACAVGLRLGWTLIDPGPRRRADALATEGRAAFAVALGLVVVLGVSGALEAFVTPSALPAWTRIAIGVAADLTFITYTLRYGKRATRAGATGDQQTTPDLPPTAA